jgi:hypothetical protein
MQNWARSQTGVDKMTPVTKRTLEDMFVIFQLSLTACGIFTLGVAFGMVAGL